MCVFARIHVWAGGQCERAQLLMLSSSWQTWPVAQCVCKVMGVCVCALSSLRNRFCLPSDRMQIISLWIAPPWRTARESALTTPPKVTQASLWVSARISLDHKPALLFRCLVCGCPFVFGGARGCVYASSLPTLGRERSPSLISHNCML